MWGLALCVALTVCYPADASDGRLAELKSVLARVKVQEVPTVFALTSGTILDVRTGPQSPLELARFVERFAQAVPA